MTTILGAAASGMVSHQGWMDAIGNNIANINTTAFKLTRAIAEGVPNAAYDLNADRLGVAGVTLDPVFRPGAALRTDDPMNFAITDESFFRVTALDGSPSFARAGLLAAGSDGSIALPGGELLAPPITVPPGTKGLAIDQLGNISGIDESGGERQVFGQIGLVRFMNPKGLLEIGKGLYRETANSGALEEGLAGTDGFNTLIAGALEGANVDLAEEFTAMIMAQRAYSASAKTFSVGDEMLQTATDLTR
jgi:flagellar basal-body rod protein FlgG